MDSTADHRAARSDSCWLSTDRRRLKRIEVEIAAAYSDQRCRKGPVMREVGAIEAQSEFGALLDSVERGEQVLIMRLGRPVARLVSASLAPNDVALAAASRIRERAKATAMFNWEEWKAYRDEGRR